jgi:hypothetical protein
MEKFLNEKLTNHQKNIMLAVQTTFIVVLIILQMPTLVDFFEHKKDRSANQQTAVKQTKYSEQKNDYDQLQDSLSYYKRMFNADEFSSTPEYEFSSLDRQIVLFGNAEPFSENTEKLDLLVLERDNNAWKPSFSQRILTSDTSLVSPYFYSTNQSQTKAIVSVHVGGVGCTTKDSCDQLHKVITKEKQNAGIWLLDFDEKTAEKVVSSEYLGGPRIPEWVDENRFSFINDEEDVYIYDIETAKLSKSSE